MRTYRVCKKVTEYHYFEIDAVSELDALTIAQCDKQFYCDTDNAVAHRIEVVNAVEVEE